MKLIILAVVFSIVYANYNYGNNVHNGYDRYKGYSYPNSVDRFTSKPSLLDFVRNALSNMYLFASNSVSYLSSGVSRVSRQLTVGGPIPPAANVALAVGAIGGKVYMDVVAPAIEAANRPAPAPAPAPATSSYSAATCSPACALNVRNILGDTCAGTTCVCAANSVMANTACGSNADRCTSTGCKCNADPACTDTSDTCTSETCKCGSNNPCASDMVGILGDKCKDGTCVCGTGDNAVACTTSANKCDSGTCKCGGSDTHCSVTTDTCDAAAGGTCKCGTADACGTVNTSNRCVNSVCVCGSTGVVCSGDTPECKTHGNGDPENWTCQA